MATFGSETEGNARYALTNIRAMACSPSGNGTLDSITAYIRTTTTTQRKFKCAIYLNSDKSFIDETEEKLFQDTGSDWVTFNFASPPSITGGVMYVLCCWCEHVNGEIWYNSSGSEFDCWRDIETYNSWPATLAVQNAWDGFFSMYGTYTGGVAHTHSASDTLSMSDSIAAVATYKHAISDTLTITDATVATILEIEKRKRAMARKIGMPHPQNVGI